MRKTTIEWLQQFFNRAFFFSISFYLTSVYVIIKYHSSIQYAIEKILQIWEQISQVFDDDDEKIYL